jgi:Domain of unknown function (DUF5916)/Carbohydrate family 9 binding domain-like
VLRRVFIALLATVVGSPAATAGQTQPAHPAVLSLQAVRATTSIAIDGRLDDEVWLRAPAASQFIQRDPDEGKPVSERTELRIAYDDLALYVGARLYDREPSRIARQLSRRDSDAEADSFTLYLDPHHDHLTGAAFSVTAAGVQADSTIYNDSSQDTAWDAVWESAVKDDETGWTVEMRLPYSQLRFPSAAHHTFGINAMRYIQRKGERAWLVHVPKNESGLASRMGHLEGLEGISPHRTAELLPYAVSRAEFVEPPGPNDPFNDGSRMFTGAGVDLKYRMSSNLSLEGTINPDFGQVEVDPAVVNLTAFETFFEEKRPFFIEGANIFSNFGHGGANNFWGFNRSEPMLFYSRRIGRAPQGTAEGDFVDQPSSSTILGAAKLTGKTRHNWSLGFIDAVTGREDAETVTNTFRDRLEVEPLTNYFVGRVQREIGRGSIGLLTTAVNRDLHTPALHDLLPGQAYVAGTDGYYFLDSKRDWVVHGSVAGSYLTGSRAAVARLQEAPQHYYQRPDAPHLHFDPTATTLGGWTGSVNVNRNSGVQGLNAAFWTVSPGFESGDAGFNFNSDRSGAHVVYQWHNQKVNRFSRERFVAFAKFYTWNYARDLQTDGFFALGNLQFKNYWTVFGNAFHFRRVQDDRATRGGPSMASPSTSGGSIGLQSDSRKRLSLNLNGDAFTSEAGFNYRGDMTVRFRPSASLEISSGPTFSRAHTLPQYVDTFADPVAASTFGSRFVFGTLDQKELSLPTRLNLVLSPRMSIQFYMQPLISVGDYTDFKELARPRTFDFVHYGIDRGTISLDPADQTYTVEPGEGGEAFEFSDPNFNFKSLRVNAIFRWEWRRGSAMYLVWTEQRQDSANPGDFAFRRDFGNVFSAPANDVLLFKIAYWFQR